MEPITVDIVQKNGHWAFTVSYRGDIVAIGAKNYATKKQCASMVDALFVDDVDVTVKSDVR